MGTLSSNKSVASLMKQWGLILAAAAASGTMLALSMPLAGWAMFGWVFLMPLLLATKSAGFFKGFVGGITAAMIGAVVSTTPLVGASAIESGTVAWNYVGFGLYGMVMAIFTALVAEVKEHSWKTMLALACVGVALELVTFIKLPAHIALSQFASSPLLAVASVTGIWGVSWLLWVANLSVLLPLNHKQRMVGVAAAMACALVSQAFSIHQRLTIDPAQIASRQPGQVGLLQTDQVGADTLLDLQKPLAEVKPKWVVWPELSASMYDKPALNQFAQSEGGWTVITSLLDDHQPKPHNAAIAFTQQGESEPYFKRQPFGEESAMVTAGTEAKVVKVLRQNVALNICFDSCFPWVLRESVLKGAEVIALPTLDPKSPNGFIQTAHAAFTTFRAAELGVPIVRAENTAWSMVVGSDGRMHSLAPVGWEGAVARHLPDDTRVTPYRTFGDWFLYACLAVIAGCAGASGRKRVSEWQAKRNK